MNMNKENNNDNYNIGNTNAKKSHVNNQHHGSNLNNQGHAKKENNSNHVNQMNKKPSHSLNGTVDNMHVKSSNINQNHSNHKYSNHSVHGTHNSHGHHGNLNQSKNVKNSHSNISNGTYIRHSNNGIQIKEANNSNRYKNNTVYTDKSNSSNIGNNYVRSNTSSSSNNKNQNTIFQAILCILLVFSFFALFFIDDFKKFRTKEEVEHFKILASVAHRSFDSNFSEWADDNDIDIIVDYESDLDIVSILNDGEHEYDAVWMSNSIWLYNLDNSSQIKNSKSIAISPVVMAVTKSVAKDLGFVGNDIYNRDILNAIKDGKINYVMTSVLSTNTGATAYLGFLNSVAGNPEVLTSDMLKDEALGNDMVAFFSGVSRISGNETYIDDLFMKGSYNAVINYESSLIALNKKLVNNGKEPLYLLYPVDGVAINDMPFAYVDRGEDKLEEFNLIQQFLLSDEAQEVLKSQGKRTWYGGVTSDIDSSVFNKEWGIDTTRYLIPLKYPSKNVITEAFSLYIDKFRRPTHTVFCVDVSGSMSESGLSELKDALSYVTDYSQASKDLIQFSSSDKVTIIPFSSRPEHAYQVTNVRENTYSVLSYINSLSAYGGTNIYDTLIAAFDMLSEEDDSYMKVVVLMTDGESNLGSYRSMATNYNRSNLDIPVYSITFGNANEKQLLDIASLTNGKVFDGKLGLKKAFKEVRSYG